MSRDDERSLLEFERALQALAEALRECERLLATVELPESVVHDETFRRLVGLLRTEGDKGSGDGGGGGEPDPQGRPPFLH